MFHRAAWSVVLGCCFFQSCVGVGVCAGEYSPCSACWRQKRDKTLPARAIGAKKANAGCAGRVLYRKCRRVVRAGRVLYRKWRRAARAGRVIYRSWWRVGLVVGGSGIKFALCAQNVPNRAILDEQGEFYTGAGGMWLVPGEFYTGSGGVWRVLGEFWPIVPPHSVDGGREAGITKPPGTRPGGGGAGDGNRTRL